jgi:glucosamine kinase
MNIYVGFDGGGTFSRYIIGRDGATPTLHHYQESIKPSEHSIAHTATRILSHLEEILGKDKEFIRGICISISGAGNEAQKKELSKRIADSLRLQPEMIFVESDSVFGLDASYQDENNAGIFCIVGSGSVITARTKTNALLKIGGWGKYFGDQGSAYDIGSETLRYFCHATDGIAEKGELFDSITSFLTSKTGERSMTVREYLYSGDIDRLDVARITLNGSNADRIGRSIIDRAIADIVSDIQAFYENHKDDVPKFITLHGGLLQTPYYQDRILDTLEHLGFGVQILGTAHLLDHSLTRAKSIGG